MTARPAPALRSVAALTALELRLAARRGENLLVTLVIPVAVLLFFGGTSLLAAADPVPALVPGTIALGIIAAGLVNLGIATAFERQYGVLKRLGGAPIPGWTFATAKVAAVLVLEGLQVAPARRRRVGGVRLEPGPGLVAGPARRWPSRSEP